MIGPFLALVLGTHRRPAASVRVEDPVIIESRQQQLSAPVLPTARAAGLVPIVPQTVPSDQVPGILRGSIFDDGRPRPWGGIEPCPDCPHEEPAGSRF